MKIFVDYDINDDDPSFEFSLMKAQHLIAELVGFKSWKELISASDTELEIAKIKLGCFSADNYDPMKIDDYEFFMGKAEQDNNTTFDNETKLQLARYYINGEDIGDSMDSDEDDSDDQNLDINEEFYEEVAYAPTDSKNPDPMVECLHCGKQFLSSETKLVKLKGQPDNTAEEVCKHWPECDGQGWDLMPAGYDKAL